MEWNDETIGRLCSLWSEGHSTAEIGRRMGVSKNAIVGKAHRLNLPGRPSPILRDGAGGRAPRRPAARRVTGPTLPPLPAVAAQSGPAAVPSAARAEPAGQAPARAPLRAVAPAWTPRATACCWPLGEPGTKTFRFCDADSTPGKPYCAEHAAIAYVKIKDRREEAA